MWSNNPGGPPAERDCSHDLVRCLRRLSPNGSNRLEQDEAADALSIVDRIVATDERGDRCSEKEDVVEPEQVNQLLQVVDVPIGCQVELSPTGGTFIAQVVVSTRKPEASSAVKFRHNGQMMK